jgi:beta-fructofuranosidase
VLLGREKSIKLRVFIDRSLVEIFVNGNQRIGLRVHPGRPEIIGVPLRSQGQDAVLKSLGAWQMARISEWALSMQISG